MPQICVLSPTKVKSCDSCPKLFKMFRQRPSWLSHSELGMRLLLDGTCSSATSLSSTSSHAVPSSVVFNSSYCCKCFLTNTSLKSCPHCSVLNLLWTTPRFVFGLRANLPDNKLQLILCSNIWLCDGQYYRSSILDINACCKMNSNPATVWLHSKQRFCILICYQAVVFVTPSPLTRCIFFVYTSLISPRSSSILSLK